MAFKHCSYILRKAEVDNKKLRDKLVLIEILEIGQMEEEENVLNDLSREVLRKGYLRSFTILLSGMYLVQKEQQP